MPRPAHLLLVLAIGSVAAAAAQRADVRGSVRTRVDDKGIEQVWVPSGTFMMGTSEVGLGAALALDPPAWARKELDSEQPAHEVRLTRGYWIDRYEVTNEAFEVFVRAQGIAPRARSESTDPRAPRGPESRIYPWGNTFDPARANVTGQPGPALVGAHPEGASWIGADDMAGNAMEWVQDWLDVSYYQQRVRDDPRGPSTGSRKVEKGGWWASHPFVARSAYRHFEDPPDYSDHHIGFRIVTP